jgi:predicted enzyme related to lactoylglutathione lyase
MPRVTFFDISADDPERAIRFYRNVFGWKIIKRWDGPRGYWLVRTGESKEPGIDGGIGKRADPTQQVTNFVSVPSVNEFAVRIINEGGRILQPKTVIEGVGYVMSCEDTERNIFAIIEYEEHATKFV